MSGKSSENNGAVAQLEDNSYEGNNGPYMYVTDTSYIDGLYSFECVARECLSLLQIEYAMGRSPSSFLERDSVVISRADARSSR